MATTIDGAFREFRTNLEITDRQESLVSQRRTNVVAALRKSLTLRTSPESLVIGSWARHLSPDTCVRATWTSWLSQTMVSIRSGSPDREQSQPSIESRRYSTWRTRTRPSVATATALRCSSPNSDSMLFQPSRATASSSSFRTRSTGVGSDPAPTLFALSITTVNQSMGEAFVPLIKMVKGWNRNQAWPIRSFHLECMLYDHCKSYSQAY